MFALSKKTLALFAMLLLSAITLAACTAPTPAAVETDEPAPGAEETEAEEPEVEETEETAPEVEETEAAAVEPVTLVVWADGEVVNFMESDPEGRGAYGNYLEKTFEAEHPGVDVVIEDHGWDETLRQNLTNALLAGNAPDVIVGEGFFKSFASLDALLPIDVSGMEDNLIPGTYEGATYDGQIYGLSGYTGVFGFERNCDVIEAAGLDCANPPTSTDELLEQASTVTEAGGGQTYGYTLQGPGGYSLGAAFRIAVLLQQVGAPMSKPGESGLDVPNFDDPDAVQVYEFLRELNATTPPGLTFEADEGVLYSQLHKGVSAYQIAGSWHVGWAQENGCTSCQYSEVPVMPGGQPASIVVANVMYGALKTSEHPELAVEFVKFTQRDDVQALVFDATHRLPSTRNALTALRPDVDTATQSYIDVVLNSENLSGMPQWEKNPQKIWQVYGDFLTKLFTTEDAVDDLMAEAQAAAMEALAQ